MKATSDSVSRLIDDWHKEVPELDPSSLGVFGRITRLSAHLGRRAERWLGPLGLTWETFSMIATLRRSGAPFELRPSDLVRLSLLSSGAMTNRIDRVEALELVVRLRDPNDRRGVIVKLTDKGQSLAEKAIAIHFEEMAGLLSPLPAKDRTMLADILTRLLVSLEDEGPAQLGESHLADSAGTAMAPSAADVNAEKRKKIKRARIAR